MKISEMIAVLEAIKDEIGDAPFVINERGDFCTPTRSAFVPCLDIALINISGCEECGIDGKTN